MTKFGINQTQHPTPQRIALLFDLLASACGIVSGFITTASFISHRVSDILTPVLTALLIPLLLLFKRFFGVDLKPGTEVPLADIKEIVEK